MMRWPRPRNALSFLFVGLLAGPANATDPLTSPSDPLHDVVESNTAFAVDLYAHLQQRQGNLFFSPVSISTTLAMTLAGARGETADEMRRTLHFTLPQPEIDQAFSRLLTVWRTPLPAEHLLPGEVDERVPPEISVANRLWVQAGLALDPAFVAITRDAYSAPIAPVDFSRDAERARGIINRWIEEQTRDRIKDLVPERALDSSSRLVLTNAIYFKSNWETQFDERNTKQDTFFIDAAHTALVPMMSQTGYMGYAKVPGAQVLEMRYARWDVNRKAFSLVIVLPDEKDGLPHLEAGLDGHTFSSWIDAVRLGGREVEVTLPRFTISADFSLKQTLGELGMKRAFATNADFSGITRAELLHIDAVIHKAFIAVDEHGTEAAAATAVAMVGSAGPEAEPPPVFRADHPFLIVLRDDVTGSVLFMGRVVDPRS